MAFSTPNGYLYFHLLGTPLIDLCLHIWTKLIVEGQKTTKECKLCDIWQNNSNFNYLLHVLYLFRKKHLKKYYGDASFNNFILYVIDKIQKYEDCTAKNLQCNAIDVHWRPFYLRCDYCDVNYNYIGRMETFEQDVR